MGYLKYAFIPLVIFQTACATATRGTHERVRIISVPEGAMAQSDMKSKKMLTYADGTESEYIGCAPTPCNINFSRRANTVVTMTKPGYDTIKFKVISTWETGSSAVKAGTIVAGLPTGSHVVAGKTDLLKRIPVHGGMFASSIFYGVGPVMDIATGANLSLSPNPVTVYFAPSNSIPNENKADEVETEDK